MEFEIPVFETKVDTSDAGKTAGNLAGAVLGGVGLLGIIGAAQYVYNRATSVAGVDSDGFDLGGGV